jgi:hypothetical protein
MRRYLIAVIFAFLGAVPAWGQNTTVQVVASCGSVPTAFVAGRAGPPTVDVNGNLCIGGSISIGANVSTTAQGVIAEAASISGNPVRVAGSNGTNLYTLKTDASGQLLMGATSNVIGKVGIDQTTPGGTNLVATNADAAIAPGTAPAKAVIIGGVYTSANPAPTDGQTLALRTDANGSLAVNARDFVAAMAGQAPGTAPASTVVTGAIYNSTAPTFTNGQTGAIRVDVKGRQIITQEKRETYSAAISGLVPAAAATDLFCVQGSATKTIVLKKARLSGTSTGTTVTTILLVKRSTANTGGTATNPTVVPHDSANPAPTAVIAAYTANPTTGTLVGNIRSFTYTMISPTANIVADIRELDFGIEEDQGIVLRGTTEEVCFNLAGASISSGLFNISVEIREIVG